MRIANIKANRHTSRIKGKTRGGKVKRAHNIGRAYRSKSRGR